MSHLKDYYLIAIGLAKRFHYHSISLKFFIEFSYQDVSYYLRPLDALNILTFPKYCFFGLEADLEIVTGKGPPVTVELPAERVQFARAPKPEESVSRLLALLGSANDSSSVNTLTEGAPALVSLTLSPVDTGLAPPSTAASSHAKYLHSDCLPWGHA